jgi:hypothetical protein
LIRAEKTAVRYLLLKHLKYLGMITRIKAVGWAVLVAGLLTTCSKDHVLRPYSYLYLRVEGHDEDIWWDAVTGQWTSNNGTLEMEGEGIYFDQFRLRLKDIIATGDVKNLTVKNIYYSDGLDFRPSAVESGYVRIVEMDSDNIRGQFRIYFENDYNNVTSKTVSGNFGVIKF